MKKQLIFLITLPLTLFAKLQDANALVDEEIQKLKEANKAINNQLKNK